MAANGEDEDTYDRSSSYYSETIVIPKSNSTKTAGAKKAPAVKPAPKTPPKPATAAAAPKQNPKVRRNKKIALLSVGIAAAVFVLCVGICIWFYFVSTADNGLIMDNTYVAGVNIGGLTPEEAKTKLTISAVGKYMQENIVINLPDTTLELSPQDVNVKLDLNLLVQDAYAYGRGGSRSDRVAAMAAAATTKREIDPLSYMTLDTSYIQQAIDQLMSQTGSVLTQPSVEIEGNRPTATLPEGARPEEGDEAVDPTEKIYQTLHITMGTPGRTFDAESLYDQILDAYSNGDFAPITVDYTIEDPQPVDLATLIQEHCSDPVDAVLNTEDYTVSDEIWGYGFNQSAAESLLSVAEYGETISLPLTYRKPAVLRPDIEATMFQDELASADTAYYFNPNRTTNLELACKAIDKDLLKPGEVFSFNDSLGERTAEKGYKPAGAYVDGETVDQVGGGICQVASTLYYCALYADLEIIEREEHMYTADYLPLGMDATVNWETLDLKFRNNTDHPIRIEANAENGYVTVQLIGTDDKSYYVEMDYKIEKEYQWETVEKKMKEDNEKGYVDGEVILSGWMGYSVDTYKSKYDKETGELISKELETHSEYEKRDKVVCKIDKPTEATTIPSTTPETTLPPSEAPDTPVETPTEAPAETPETPTEAPAETPSDSEQAPEE